MPTRDPRVDTYIAGAPAFARPILRHLRTVVHRACPDVVETIKWRSPHFEHRGLLCGMGAFKAHVLLYFPKADLLTFDGRPLQQRGQAAVEQFGRLTAVEDLPRVSALTALVRQAARLNEAGTPVPRASTRPLTPADVPADLRAALRANAAARAVFTAFPPGRQREYVEWITEARRDETRARRVETAVAWIAEGRHRNWKYEK